MSVHSGPEIPNDSLILSLDSSNIKSVKGRRSVIKWDNWVVGTGSVSGYPSNGDGNSRVLDTNPFGVTDVVWQSLNNDAASDPDGGWEGSMFSIDPSKMYRFTTWVRRKVIGNGSFYLGPHSNWGSVAGQFILNRSNSAENQNPYFFASDWWGNANDWYLVVGHVWPAGSGSGSVHPDSGVYDTSGTRVRSASDYMWAPTNTQSFHRSYLYYSTNSATNQQWYQPRVDICDGSEPSLSELLNDAGNTWYDLSGNGNHFRMYNLPSYSNNVLSFNGTNQWAQSKNNINLTSYNSITTEIVLRSTATSSSYMAFEHTANWNTTSGGLGLSVHSNGSANALNIHHTNHNGGPARNYALTVGTNIACHTNIFSRISDSTGRITYGNANLLAFSTVNGYATSTSTTTNNFANSIMYLASRGGTTSYYAGEIFSFRVYNKKLTSSEVSQSHRSFKSRYGI